MKLPMKIPFRMIDWMNDNKNDQINKQKNDWLSAMFTAWSVFRFVILRNDNVLLFEPEKWSKFYMNNEQ